MTPTGRFFVIVLLVSLVASAPAAAHEIPRSVTVHTILKPEGNRLRVVIRAPLAAMRDIQFPEREGMLDVERAQPDLLDAVARWILPTLVIHEDGRPLGMPTIAAVRVSLPSDRSFASFESAIAHVTAPPDFTVRVPWQQAWLDTVIEYPIASATARFAIRPGFERLGVDVVTAIRFASGETVRAFELYGDPGLVQLDPRWHQAAWHFIKLGFAHILDGIDHLLFLFCLVIPFRRLRPLILVVTAFTVAHSITLIASALGFAPNALWFPPLVETLIAASILYLALENILAKSPSSQRWAIAFAFGLVHGFGFSFALRETLQFAGAHLLTSLLAFNVGVEIGQVLVLLVAVPALGLLFRAVPERMGIIVLSALVAHTAWHWMADRLDALRQYEMPGLDTNVWLVIVRVLLVVAIGGAAAWWFWRRGSDRGPATETVERGAR